MKASYYHAIALCAYLSLFSLLMLWNTVLSPPEKLPVALLLIITVTPLLLVCPKPSNSPVNSLVATLLRMVA
jgi:uncharacterized membrane protein